MDSRYKYVNCKMEITAPHPQSVESFFNFFGGLLHRDTQTPNENRKYSMPPVFSNSKKGPKLNVKVQIQKAIADYHYEIEAGFIVNMEKLIISD